MKQKAYLVFITLAVLCMVGWTGYSQKRTGPRASWQFTTVYTEEEANTLGFQGWELVTVRSDLDVRGGTGNSRAVFHLKRTRF